ncbi:MAG: universal stress protein [Sandaracinaceae bacterium]|nr:universal stress protein [Sandaracinaceae bacterium]
MTEPTRKPYKIVVGVDFEATGDVALADALRLLREHPNDELHAAFVVRRAKKTFSAAELAQLEREMASASERLEARVQNLCEAIFPGESWEQAVHFHVRLGDAAEQLLQVAIDYDADLLVVGTHARKGVEKLLLGSVAQRLIETACLPVLVAREKHFEGRRTSDRAEAARPGELLEDASHRTVQLGFGRRSSHISGLL